MLSICVFCRKQKEVEPKEDKRETHGECDVCHSYNIERIQLRKELRKLAGSSLILNAKKIEEISNKIESIDNILAFRKYANEPLRIRFAREG